jgi:hypothetical protein
VDLLFNLHKILDFQMGLLFNMDILVVLKMVELVMALVVVVVVPAAQDNHRPEDLLTVKVDPVSQILSVELMSHMLLVVLVMDILIPELGRLQYQLLPVLVEMEDLLMVLCQLLDNQV